ncbi:MAG TPA: hypothetical protein VEI47_05525 [Gemmatimonadales bacterium]|nr:hypothetical protein [Gemmatimonadales bacterium]
MLLLVLSTAPLRGQSPFILTQDIRFTKNPGAQSLGTLLAGAEVTPGKTQRNFVEVAIDGWLPAASVAARRRDNFDVAVSKRPNESLRATPEGAVIARVTTNVGFTKLETQGTWVHVKRSAWIDQKAVPPAPAPAQVESGPDRAEVIHHVPVAIVPQGAPIGAVDSGVGVRVLAHSAGWTRVQLEAWVPDSTLRSTDNRILVGLSQAEVRANPARYIGQMVEWRLQFVAIQKADELRPEIPEGMTYLLTRGPLPEPGFVYVVVPSSQVAQFQSVPALKELTIRGTIRAASTKFLPTPVLDLVDVVDGLGK